MTGPPRRRRVAAAAAAVASAAAWGSAPVAALRRPADDAAPLPAEALGLEEALWTWEVSASCRPAPGKEPRVNFTARQRRDCGEDAFFIAAPTPAEAVLGIADGVGGWREDNVDPAFFAWALMEHCHDVAEGVEGAPCSYSIVPDGDDGYHIVAQGNLGDSMEFPAYDFPGDDSEAGESADLGLVSVRSQREVADPVRVLELGYESLLSTGDSPVGSSTAVVASLERRQGILRIANLGDSGALLLRGPTCEIVLQTKPQQHTFQLPLQLMRAPEGMSHMSELGDQPHDADVYEALVEDGDLLLLGTDGLFDNLFPHQIAEIVAHVRDSDAEAIADRLVRDTYKLSTETWIKSTPYGKAAAEVRLVHLGGKQDDITVMIARLGRNAAAAPPEP